ncbi:hypothetical protein D4R52_01620 [bacterium]|nr:MAG: hypothetical protein D4R52_01620 [bacterium]
MLTYYHLKEIDYVLVFPAGLDPVPVLIDKRTFFDAWIMNRMCVMVRNIEQLIIDNPDLFGD